MGQIIDLEPRRRPTQPPSTTSNSPSWDWWGSHAIYVDSVVVPAIDLWRATVLTWARFWLAPIGLEITAVGRPRPPATDRADGSR